MLDDVNALFYGDDAPHPHDTGAPGIAGLLSRDDYDELVESLCDEDWVYGD